MFDQKRLDISSLQTILWVVAFRFACSKLGHIQKNIQLPQLRIREICLTSSVLPSRDKITYALAAPASGDPSPQIPKNKPPAEEVLFFTMSHVKISGPSSRPPPPHTHPDAKNTYPPPPIRRSVPATLVWVGLFCGTAMIFARRAGVS